MCNSLEVTISDLANDDINGIFDSDLLSGPLAVVISDLKSDEISAQIFSKRDVKDVACKHITEDGCHVDLVRAILLDQLRPLCKIVLKHRLESFEHRL